MVRKKLESRIVSPASTENHDIKLTFFLSTNWKGALTGKMNCQIYFLKVQL